MMGVADSALLASGGSIANKLAELGYSMPNFTTGGNSFYEEIYQATLHQPTHFDQFAGHLGQAGADGLQLPRPGSVGHAELERSGHFDLSAGAWAVIGLFLIPIISTGLSYLSMYISQKMNPTTATMTRLRQQSSQQDACCS